jgi:hypothetical protein
VAQWKDTSIRPWRPEFGSEGKHLFLEIDDFYFLFLGSSEAAMGGGGAQRPVGRGNKHFVIILLLFVFTYEWKLFRKSFQLFLLVR